MMPTYGEVFKKLSENHEIGIQNINGNLMEVSRSTKKRDAFLKVAVTEELAANYLNLKPQKVGFIVTVDREVFMQVVESLKKEKTE